MPHAGLFTVRVFFIVGMLAAMTAQAQVLTVEPDALQYGRIRHGSDRCQNLRIINRSGQPVELLSIWHPKEPFPVNPSQQFLAPGDTVYESICYEMRRLGPDTSTVHLVFDAGAHVDSVLVPAYALGWDSLSVGIGVTVSGKPGSVLRIPIRVFGDIPAGHDIRKVRFTIQYNKTLLYPLPDAPSELNSVVSGMNDLRVHVERDFSRDPVTATYELSGNSPLVSPATDSILFRPAFLVLQGNAMSCDVTVTQVRFSDGMPLGGAFLKGKFEADSICYQRFRLVDHPPVLSEPEIGSFPNPANSSMMLHCMIPKEDFVRISLHTMLGEEIDVVWEGVLTVGDHALPLNVGSLPRGRYVCRIVTAGGASSTSSLVLQ